MAKATELLERLVTLQEQQMGMLQGGGQAASSSSSDYSAGSQRAASALRRGAVRGALGGSVGDGDTAATKEAAAAAREYADALESLRVGIKELSGPMTQQRKNQEMLAIAVTKNTIASRKLSGEQKKGEGRIAKSNSLYYGLQDRIQGITVAMESWEQATQEVDAVQGSLFRTIGRGMGSGLGKLGVSVGVVAVALQGLALQSRNAKFHMQAMFELGMSPARALAQHDMIFSDYNRVMNDAAETAMDFGASSDDARQMVSNLTSALRIPLSGRSVESYAKEVDSLVVSLHAVEVLGVKNEEATAAWESQIYGMGKSSRYALQMVRDLQTSVYDLGRRYEGKVKPEVFANIALGLADSTDTWVSGFDQAVASMHVVYDEALKVTGMGGKMMEATERITKQMREVPEWFQFHMGAKFLQDAEGNTNRFQKVMKSLGESERKAFQFLLDSDLAPFRQAQVLGKELMNTVHGAESLAEFVKGFGGTGGTEMLIQLGFNPKDAAIFMHALGESGVGGIQDRLIEIRKQGVAFGDKLNDMAADAKWRGGWMESLANNAAALMNNTWFSVSALAAVATWRALMIGQMVTQTGLMGTLVAQGMGGTAAQIGSTAARTGGALADAADTATAAAAGSIPYSSFKISANSFTSLTVRLTSSSASFFKSAIFYYFKKVSSTNFISFLSLTVFSQHLPKCFYRNPMMTLRSGLVTAVMQSSRQLILP